MAELSARTLESLIRAHCPDLNGAIAFSRIQTGKFNTSFFVRGAKQELVLRIAPPRDAVFVFYEREMMRQEPGIHDLVRSQTTVPVPRILVFDDSHQWVDRDFLIMERLPGRPLTEAGHVSYDDVLRQVGRHLAEVHRLRSGAERHAVEGWRPASERFTGGASRPPLTAERYGYLGPHRPMEPQRTWVAAFEIMWHKMIQDIASVGHYSSEDSRMLRRLLDKHLGLFDRPVPASLLHMDIWHQNILVDEFGKVTGLLDWDRALWGDPEIEFAVLDYCGISEPAFWEGYGRQRDESGEARFFCA